MELTPELFEKIEFAERRKGYDTEQVETFLEQAGTALAQMLARFRHNEERVSQAEARLVEADQKLAHAEQVLAEADRRVREAEQRVQAAQQASSPRADEAAEVEQAAKTLLMAQRTADATVNEARGQAQSLLEDAQARADRRVAEVEAQAEDLLRQAGEQAEAEFAGRRAAAQGEVQSLEARRAQLTDVIHQLEARLDSYREDLVRAAEEIASLAQDPTRLGARGGMSIQADEVLLSEQAESAPAAPTEVAAHRPEPEFDQPVAPEHDEEVSVQAFMAEDALDDPVDDEPLGGVVEQPADDPGDATATAPVADALPVDEPGSAAAAVDATPHPQSEAAAGAHDDGERTQFLDLTSGSDDPDARAPGDRWGPGSWSEVHQDLDDEPEDPRREQRRDRFMEELDSAVNEAVDLDDDAMRAFFEGTSDSRARRFGWRR